MSSAVGNASRRATSPREIGGTPSPSRRAVLVVVPVALAADEQLGQHLGDAVDRRPQLLDTSRATGSGRRRWRRNQRLARSTSLRDSRYIDVCVSTATIAVERLDVVPAARPGRRRRARLRARARCRRRSRRSPRRGGTRTSMPARLTRPLTSAVAMISRRSGWRAIRVDEALAHGEREVAYELRREVGVVGQRGARAAPPSSAILAYASSTASSGAVRPRPALRRSASSSSVGSASTVAVEVARLLERADEPRVHVFHRRGLRVRVVERARSGGSCRAARARATSSVMVCEQRVAVVDGELAGRAPRRRAGS